MKFKYCHDKTFTRLIIELFKYYVNVMKKILMKIEKFDKNCGRPGGGGGVSKFGHPRARGEGGQKRANFCGRPLWMPP